MIGTLDSINNLIVPPSNKGNWNPTIDYLVTYDKYFEPYRDKECTVIELGVYQGSSIALWGRYFSKAKIYGIEMWPENLVPELKKEIEANKRIKLFIGDYTKEPFISDIMKEIGPIDILVDDADHHVDIQCKTVDYFQNYLAPDGVFCMEDVFSGAAHIWGPENVNGSEKFEEHIEKNTDLEIIEHHWRGSGDHLFIMRRRKNNE